ncbi:MAG: site-2 protease family protein [bacterium]|nr:site-2 protease family protein [bacterium]
MRSSFKLCRLFGVDLYIHWTFLLLVGWIAVSRFAEGFSLAGILASLAILAVVFAIVVMHELGHSLAARRLGISTKDILLLPIGGAARLERLPERPWDELFVAGAGPMVNFVLGGAAFLYLHFDPAMRALAVFGSFAELAAVILWWFARVNLGLLLFNLVPAFPMDGGRILRALIGFKKPYLRATEIAVNVGRVFLALFGIYGLFSGSFMLILIAVFIWRGGSQELEMVRWREYMRSMQEGGQAGAMDILANFIKDAVSGGGMAADSQGNGQYAQQFRIVPGMMGWTVERVDDKLPEPVRIIDIE